jgi:hypothetical protein
MVEAAANSVEDFLVDSLSFKLRKGASYINERKSVTFHPQGSNIYSTQGTKLIKLLISGDQWLDPSTFRVMFDLVNMESDAAKQLRVLGGPWSFFRRMRVLCNGAIVEDIDDYNRVHQMFNIMTAGDSRINELSEGFGQHWDIKEDFDGPFTAANFPGIRGGQSRTVLFKPLSGLLAQPKYLPLRYCPLTIELELVNDSTLPIISYLSGSEFTAANTSLLWQIQNVQVKTDICTLDNSLDNSYVEHLLSGKALPINYNTYVSQIQSTLSGINGQKDIRHNVTRSLSRLKSVFITFDKAVTSEDTYIGRKPWNDFYSPMNDYAGWNQDGEFEFQLQLGSKLYPEYPIRSHSEAFYQLRKTLGMQSSNIHSFDIDYYEYRRWKFIIATDMEKVLEAGFTGMNTRAGDILNISFKHNQSNIPENYVTSMHVVLQSDNIMEIRDGGVQVFD